MDLVRRIEEIDAPATGAFVLDVGGRRRGTVLLEERRVCWAASRGMGRRLTDLLVERSRETVTRPELEQAFVDCRKTGVPLGEELVRRGVLDPVGLSWALARHSAEALHALASNREGGWRWLPHQRRTYDPRFTFSMSELLVEVGSMHHATQAARANRLLGAIGDVGAIAFVTEDSGAAVAPFVLPVAATGRALMLGGAGVQLLASSALAALANLRMSTNDELISWRSEDGLHIGVWRHQRLLFAIVDREPAGLARLFALRQSPLFEET